MSATSAVEGTLSPTPGGLWLGGGTGSLYPPRPGGTLTSLTWEGREVWQPFLRAATCLRGHSCLPPQALLCQGQGHGQGWGLDREGKSARRGESLFLQPHCHPPRRGCPHRPLPGSSHWVLDASRGSGVAFTVEEKPVFIPGRGFLSMFLTNIRLNAIFSGGTFEEEHGRKKATSCACASTGVRSTLRRRDCRRPGQVLLKTCGAKFAREGVWPRLTPLPSAAGPRRCRATPCWELGFTSRHDSQAGRASPAAECSSCTARGFGYRLRPGRCRPDTRLGSQRAGSRIQVPSGRREAAYLGSLPAGGPGLVLQP